MDCWARIESPQIEINKYSDLIFAKETGSEET